MTCPGCGGQVSWWHRVRRLPERLTIYDSFGMVPWHAACARIFIVYRRLTDVPSNQPSGGGA